MQAKSIELILFRQLAYYLAIPIFIVDINGNLLFCNEEAENILGFRFSDTGEMPAAEWSTVFIPQDKEGNMIPAEKLPLSISYKTFAPAFDCFYIRNLRNEIKYLSVSTLPIINQIQTVLGAVAFFQEIPT